MRLLNKQSGFSLIELLIVLAVLAIIMSLINVQTTFLQRIFMRSEVEKLYALCHYARQAALVSNRAQEVCIDVHHNQYRYQDRLQELPAGVVFGFIPGVKGPPSAPNAPIMKASTFAHDTITMHSTGIIQPGTVYLVDDKKQIMYALSSAVSQASYMRLYRYDRKWQLLS
jgi:prepilin-type N-terminal cleavage/methylation domain-containing protein